MESVQKALQPWKSFREQKMNKKIIIIGASGHGKVVADLAIKNEFEIYGFVDDGKPTGEHFGFPILGRVDRISDFEQECEFVIAIGNNGIRKKIAENYPVKWAKLIHPTAVIGLGAEIGEGTVVMANAVINSDAKVGKHCIINTAAVVEHDNFLEDYVHISPNASLAGTVSVGEKTHIGIGAVVRNNLKIASDVGIGAGAIVVKNIQEQGIYYGVPAKRRD